MYTCPLHQWSSLEIPCPSCHTTVTTSGDQPLTIQSVPVQKEVDEKDKISIDNEGELLTLIIGCCESYFSGEKCKSAIHRIRDYAIKRENVLKSQSTPPIQGAADKAEIEELRNTNGWLEQYRSEFEAEIADKNAMIEELKDQIIDMRSEMRDMYKDGWQEGSAG